MTNTVPKPSTPNIFSIATSELSQDALITWLLQWADTKYATIQPELHSCGQKLVRALCDIHSSTIDTSTLTFNKVEVKRQWNKLDILCKIDDHLVILIEDKTNTQDHSNQLQKHYDNAEKEFTQHTIIPIYFKTGDQGSYSSLLNTEWKPFLSNDFLAVLRTYTGNNAIMVDFIDYLQNIEFEVQSYASKPIDKWTERQWIGFYMALQKQPVLVDTRNNKHTAPMWRRVVNPGGSFYGFYWHWNIISTHGFKIYLQLEQHKLCIKVHNPHHGDKANTAIDQANQAHIATFKKALRTHAPHFTIANRKGKTATIGYYDTYRVHSQDRVNIDDTVKLLQASMQLVDKLIASST